MSWLSSHMDPYRLPVLVTALLVSAFTYTIFNSDHAYEVRTWEGTPPPLGPAEATKAWIDHHPVDEFPAVVFIAASGGGIKAAVWTSTVLAGLTEDKAIGTKFPRSVVLLSTVSGGTVGAMYFVNAYKDGRPPGPAEARAGVAKAGTSSLSAVAWGLAYPDFWRIVFSPAVPADRDRGWALEERWRIALDDPGQTLSTWRAGIQQGWRPVPIFNATVVETGDRLTISPIDVPQGDRGAGLVRTQKTPRRLDFRDLYPGRDLHVATAARLSATFPWVSSVARPGDRTIPESQRYHVGDGGYFDNDGVVSALEFMDEALGQLYEEPPKRAPRTAVLIRIRASPLSKKAGAKDGDGWVHSLAGPLLAMLNVRTASQTVRDDDEVDRFQAYWECSGVTVRVVSFVLTVDASMSWHLSPEEKDAIESEWRGLAVDADKESPERPGGRDLRELRSLFAKKPR